MSDPRPDSPRESQQAGARTETHSEPDGATTGGRAGAVPDRGHAHRDDGMTGPHGSMDDHGETHGHDDHGHASASTLGPIDTRAWGAGLLGVVLGVVVAAAFALASGTLKL